MAYWTKLFIVFLGSYLCSYVSNASCIGHPLKKCAKIQFLKALKNIGNSCVGVATVDGQQQDIFFNKCPTIKSILVGDLKDRSDLESVAGCTYEFVENNACATEVLKFIGSFSYEEATEEHQYFYQIDLWQGSLKTYGIYYFSGGLQGDSQKPMGMRISGKVTSGRIELDGDKYQFSFKGSMSEDNLMGNLQDSITSKQKITLKRTKSDTTRLPGVPLKLEDWEKWVEKTLSNDR